MATAIEAAHVYIWSILMISIFTSVATFERCSIIGFPPLSSEAQVEELQKMELLDFFVGPSMHSESEVVACDIDEQKQTLLKFLEANNIKPKTLVEDMSKMEISSPHFVDIPLGTMDWNNYHGPKSINAWLDKVVKKYPKLISMEVIWTSFEARIEQRAYKIEKPGGPSKKRGAYVQCLIHGREWTTSGVCTYIINELTANSDRYSNILGDIRFYIVPIANPDGYHVSNESGGYLWRKNRVPVFGHERRCNVSGQGTLGVDLNRNWPFQWKKVDDACSPMFSGEDDRPHPDIGFLMDWVSSHKDIDTFIDVHCYSQFIMFPWGYTKERAENYDALMRLAKDAADAAESVAGTKFQAGQVSHLLNLAHGTAVDWERGPGKIPYSFALKVRPTSRVANGQKYVFPFRVPPNEILPVAKETWLAVLTLATKRKQSSDILSNAAQPNLCTFFIALSVCSILLPTLVLAWE